MVVYFRRARKRRIQRRRLKRASSGIEVDFSGPNQPSQNTEVQSETEYVNTPGVSVKCPSAKYFVHPRVAFSVRGRYGNSRGRDLKSTYIPH